jgi:hypothetical protein
MKKEYYEQLKSSREKWDILADVDTVGKMDFWTTIVELCGFTREDLDPQSRYYQEAIATAVHEYTHFIDYTSTLWGLKNLRMLNDAYITNYVNYSRYIDEEITESHFYKQKEIYDKIYNLRLPDYYTEKGSPSKIDVPWHFQLTCGVRFDNNGKVSRNPIIFCNFQNESKEKIVRSPLSILSILEASAVSQEYLHRFMQVQKNDDSYYVEINNLKNQLLKFIYDADLTVYSVAFHLVSAYTNIDDFF